MLRALEQMQKSVRVAPFTFPGDPMRLDYLYGRNGTRGFLQTLSVTGGHRGTPNFLPTPPNASPNWLPVSSLQLRMSRCGRKTTGIVLSGILCAMRGLNRCPWKVLRCGWRSCGPCCNSDADSRYLFDLKDARRVASKRQ